MNTIFIDIDTQLDFLYPAGALYVPGAERLIPALTRLTQYAAQHGIPLVSTVDAHAEDDIEFRTWPKHCVAGGEIHISGFTYVPSARHVLSPSSSLTGTVAISV